jgi:hypothetical protein
VRVLIVGWIILADGTVTLPQRAGTIKSPHFLVHHPK